LPTVIVRPAAVYGPGDRDFLELFRLARHGVAIHAANREHWLSIIHVTDVARAIVRAAVATEAPGRAYCLGNPEPVQWAELFRLAARCANRELRIDIDIPSFVIDAGAAVGDVVARVTGRAGLLTTPKVALSKARFWTCSSTARGARARVRGEHTVGAGTMRYVSVVPRTRLALTTD
jgi:nucleoside-diphosphate-sugar epimerase